MAIHPTYEKTLIEIARALPTHRVEQLVDFARFLESQSQTDEVALDDHDISPLQPNQVYYLYTPYNASDTGEQLMAAMSESTTKD
jgi:hypothetical protein